MQPVRNIHDLIDLDRYPLDQPDDPAYRALVHRCQACLEADGLFNLDGFLREGAAGDAVAQLMPDMRSESFHHRRAHNIYFRKSIPELASDHPALAMFETANRTLCADQLTDNPVTMIYEWSPLRDFLAKVMDRPALHLMADPLARVNVMAYRAGAALNWHFDRSEFTTTLLLQTPQSGGVFQYRRDLRTEDDPNYDGVAQLLQGHDEKLRDLTLSPGTLNVFRGKNTAHRVTPVAGDRDRVIAVFSYYETAGVMFSDDEQRGFYGRSVSSR